MPDVREKSRRAVLALAVLLGTATLLTQGAQSGTQAGGHRPPWACDQLEQPTLDRQASRHAKPIPYKDPGWLFRLIGRYAPRHRGAWAGFYFDTSPEGNPVYFHFLFDQDVLRHARAIRRGAKIPSALRFSKAPVSLRELGAISQRIGREQFDQDPPDPYLGGTASYLGEDEPTNSLDVGLEDYTREAAAAFHERYGPRVCVKLRDAEPFELF